VKQDTASATARMIAAAVFLAAHDRSLAALVPPTAAEWSARFLAHAPKGPLLMQSIRPALGRRAWTALEHVVQPGMIRHWLARKIWIETRVRAAIDAGATRLVVVAGGLDTLGVRLALEHPSLRVTEIDHPATQSIKRAALGSNAPMRLEPCDLVHEPLCIDDDGDADGLPKDEAVGDRNGDGPSTIVLLEGLLMYLDDRQVRALLGRILDCRASRLRMLASVMVSRPDGSIGFEPRRPMVDWWLRMMREPFRSSLRAGDADAFFSSIANDRHHWRVTAHADATALERLGGGKPIARGEEVFECERVKIAG